MVCIIFFFFFFSWHTLLDRCRVNVNVNVNHWGPCRADIGALLLPACSGRVLGCQASAARHATRVMGRGRTFV